MSGKQFQVCDWPAVRAALRRGRSVSASDTAAIRDAVNQFLQRSPERVSKLKAAATSTSEDFPTSKLPLWRTFQEGQYYDDAWERVFDVIDFSDTPRNGFEILDIEDGLTFKKVPEGQKAQVYKVAGEKTVVEFDMYGGGLGWSKKLIDDKEYWSLEHAMTAFRNKWYAARAKTAYALLEAVSSAYDITWQPPVPSAMLEADVSYAAVRDIETINAACYAILTAVKDKGYQLGPDASFVLLYPFALHGRIQRALGVLNAGTAGTFKGVQYTIEAIPTLNLSSESAYYIALPKNKLIWGDRMPLSVFDKFEPASYSVTQYAWGRYGGAIGDSNQIRRCATSA